VAESTGAPQPITAANIVKRDGDWVYLDEEGAKRHPLYGVRSGAAILASLLAGTAVLGGLFDFDYLLAAVRLGRDQPGAAGIIGAIGAIAMAIDMYMFFVASRLWRMRDNFQRHFAIVAAITFVHMIVMVVKQPEISMLRIAEIVVLGLFAQYVFRSVRINVTTRKRVLSSDALVRELVVDMDPHLPKGAK
jgi:hypothetical protein